MTILEAVRLRLEEIQSLRASSQDLNDDCSPHHLPSPTSPTWLSHLGAEHPDDAAELAQLLNEAAPKLGLQRYQERHARQRPTPTEIPRSLSRVFTGTGLKERLKAAVPVPSAENLVDWTRLIAVVSTEALGCTDDADGALAKLRDEYGNASNQPPMTPGGSLVEVNSGGKVLFCLFEPLMASAPAPTPPVSRHLTPIPDGSSTPTLFPSTTPKGTPVTPQQTSLYGFAPTPSGVPRWQPAECAREGCLVIKFTNSRLLTQSEQFAAELAKHIGVAVPESRILRKDNDEWKRVMNAAECIADRCPDLFDECTRNSCMLIMEYIPSKGLLSYDQAFEPPLAQQTFHDLGRLLALDMLLGNPDRLRVDSLGWRGNSENVLAGTSGRFDGRVVAIDAVVQASVFVK
jgi:hypothetical protein